MKKLFALMLMFSLLFPTGVLLAQGGVNPGPGGQGAGDPVNPGRGSGGGGDTGGLINPLRADSIEQLLEVLVDFAVRIGFLVVIVMLVIVGFMFVAARGNPEKIKDARTALLWTLVGAVILVGATIIVEVIKATVDAISA